MRHNLVWSADARRDFAVILDFLIESHIAFGDDADTALTKAEARIEAIIRDVEGLARMPWRGTLHDDLLPGLRHVTLDRAIVWFDILDDETCVRILAVFFGGADHVKRMIERLRPA